MPKRAQKRTRDHKWEKARAAAEKDYDYNNGADLGALQPEADNEEDFPPLPVTPSKPPVAKKPFSNVFQSTSSLHTNDAIAVLANLINTRSDAVEAKMENIDQEVKLPQTLRGDMAQKRVQLDRFSCSICLDLLKDPVTTPCGHSYCMKCVEDFWDGEDQKKIHSCPQCRKTFTPRPVLQKNIILAALVEQLKTSGLQAAPADHSCAGPEDVSCDVCTGRKLKAIKSCLMCLVSYCEEHVQPHYDVAQLKKHQLVEPSKKLHENICSRHDEVMKMFCRTDQQIICLVCSVDDEHKGHDIVLAAAERREKQKELQVMRENIQQRIQGRETDVKLLQQQLEAIDVSADQTVEDSEKIFSELIRLVQKSSEVKQQIRSQQETEAGRVRELQEKLQQEITELKRKDAELKQLSHTEDHNQFVHSYQSVSALSESPHSSSISDGPLRYFEDVTAAVSQLRDELQDILRDTWTNMSLRGTEGLLSEPKSRADFIRYSRDITLDPNTAHTHLLLSEGNRKVTYMNQNQFYPDHPDRFTSSPQILSKESLTGRCYWEVKLGRTGGEVAVSYKDVDKTWSAFGRNDKSWALHGYKENLFHHNSITSPISGCVVFRVGVYLDHRAGVLSFYSISETMTLLRKVQTSFTRPLHAGIRLWCNCKATAEICKLK